MNDLLLTRLQDCSTRERFQFYLRCGECGKIWYSSPLRFSRANAPPAGERQVVYEIIRKREREAALRLACGQAKECFNICPVCGRLVCDDCFLVGDELDMCRSCAQRLGETPAERKTEEN